MPASPGAFDMLSPVTSGAQPRAAHPFGGAPGVIRDSNVTQPVDIEVAIWTDRLRRSQQDTAQAVAELQSLGVFGEYAPEFGLRRRPDGRAMWGYRIKAAFTSLRFPEDQEANARVAYQKVLDAWLQDHGFPRPGTESVRRSGVQQTSLAVAAPWMIEHVRSADGPAQSAEKRHRALVITIRLAELFFPNAKLNELRQADLERWVAWLSGKLVDEVRRGQVAPIEKARAPDGVKGALHGIDGAKAKAMDLRNAMIAFARGHESVWTPLFEFKLQRGDRMEPVPSRQAVGRVLQVMRYGCSIDPETRDWKRRTGFSSDGKKKVQRRVLDAKLVAQAGPYLRAVRIAAATGLRFGDIYPLRYDPSPLGGHMEVCDLTGARLDGQVARPAEEIAVRLFPKPAGAPVSKKRSDRFRLLHGPGQMVVRWRNQDRELIEARRDEPLPICRDAEGEELDEMSDYIWDKIIRRAGLWEERFTMHQYKAHFVTNMFHRAGYSLKEIAARVRTRPKQLVGYYIGEEEEPDYDGPKNLYGARAKPKTAYLDDTTGLVRPGSTLRRDADGRRIPPAN